MSHLPYIVTLANSPAALRVASFTAALAVIAAARAVRTVQLVNVFDAQRPGIVAVYIDSDEQHPAAAVQRAA